MIRWAGQVARIGEMINLYKITVVKSELINIMNHRCRRKDNIKVYFTQPRHVLIQIGKLEA